MDGGERAFRLGYPARPALLLWIAFFFIATIINALSVSRSSRAGPLVCCQQDERRREGALNPSSMEMREIRIDVPEVRLLLLLLPVVVLAFPTPPSWRLL